MKKLRIVSILLPALAKVHDAGRTGEPEGPGHCPSSASLVYKRPVPAPESQKKKATKKELHAAISFLIQVPLYDRTCSSWQAASLMLYADARSALRIFCSLSCFPAFRPSTPCPLPPSCAQGAGSRQELSVCRRAGSYFACSCRTSSMVLLGLMRQASMKL